MKKSLKRSTRRSTQSSLLRSLPDKPRHGLWQLLGSYRTIYLVALAFLGIAVAAETGGFLLLRHYVDEIIVKQRWAEPIFAFAAGFLGLSLVRGVFSYLSGRYGAFTAEHVIRNVRNSLYDQMQRLSFAYHDKTKTGELIQRSTSDVDTLRRFYSEMIRGITRVLFLFGINFAAIVVLKWQLALMTIVTVPLTFFVSIKFFGRIHNAYEAYQEQDGALSSVLQENLTGVRIVRAFARREFEEEKFEVENRKKLELGFKFTLSHAAYWPISESLGGIQIVLGLLVGGIMVMNGSLSIGTYVAYTGLARGIISRFNSSDARSLNSQPLRYRTSGSERYSGNGRKMSTRDTRRMKNRFRDRFRSTTSASPTIRAPRCSKM